MIQSTTHNMTRQLLKSWPTSGAFVSRFVRGLVLALGLSWASISLAGSPEGARDFIVELAAQALQVLETGNKNLAEREAAVRAILKDAVALDFIARYSAGAYWQRASDDERGEYRSLFKEFFLRNYASRLGGYQGEKFEVVGARSAGKRDTLVNTRIVPADGTALRAGWRVREFDGVPRVIDIVVEGVSVVRNQRQEFQSLLKREGMMGLIEVLRARTERVSVQAPG